MSFFSGNFFAGQFFEVATVQVVNVGGGGLSWQDHVTKANLAKYRELRTVERQLKKVEKKIILAEKRVVVQRTEGVLANLHRLEVKRMEIEEKIFRLKLDLQFPEFNDDEDDIEAILFDS